MNHHTTLSFFFDHLRSFFLTFCKELLIGQSFAKMAAELKSLPIAPTSKTDIAQSLDEDVQSSSAAPKAEFKLMSSDKTVYFLPREYLHISKVLRDELNSVRNCIIFCVQREEMKHVLSFFCDRTLIW